MNAKEESDNDYRYQVSLFLIRDGRPKYWTFHCPYCTAKVCELDGSLVHVRDVSNEASGVAVRVRCPGTGKSFQGYCRMWYSITLSA